MTCIKRQNEEPQELFDNSDVHGVHDAHVGSDMVFDKMDRMNIKKASQKEVEEHGE